MRNPKFFEKITNSLYRGLHDVYLQERSERLDVETIAISTLSVINEEELKNISGVIEEYIDKIRHYKVDWVKKKINNC